MSLIPIPEGKDINRVAGGLKATVKNPNVSDEAKASAQERLHEMGTSADSNLKPTDAGKSPTSSLP